MEKGSNHQKCFTFIKNELRGIFKNKILLSYTCILLILVIFIGLVYQKGVLGQMELLLVDLDQTSTSRLVTRYLTENEKFKVVFSDNEQEVIKAVEKSEVIAGLVIPDGFEAAVKEKKGGEILLLIDGTNYIAANSIYAKANEILLSINGGIALQSLTGAGFLPDEAGDLVQPTHLTQNILFNPHYNYSYYLTYGICGAGIFSLAMSAVALSLSKSKVESPPWKSLGAKILVYCLYFSLVLTLLFVFAQIVFDLPARGSILPFYFLALEVSLLITILGMMLSAIAGDKEERIFQLGVFFATTLFFTTGYSWPLQSLPEIMKPVYYLNPLTPFLNGVRACFVIGAESRVLENYILWQLALCLFYALPGLGLYHWRYRKGKMGAEAIRNH
ncbi:ABC transporter permease [Dehalobacterium formicoaceticum]|uniref:ABC transporter permease n=1 Tax=Dehalobacterium formicoaceticum TaxID=51515 RepID=A0ABT1Y3C4_9FIRM|nr:ABC transporter permease [Dehalobacterium formicoaceticum]